MGRLTQTKPRLGNGKDCWQTPCTMTIRWVALIIALSGSSYALLSVAATEQETLRYTVVSNGKTQGNEVDTFAGEGRIESTFEFNDRGRGPKISAHYVVSAGRMPLRTDITGNHYLKAPVDEHFAVENGRAHWKSTSEDGSGAEGGFYVSNNGPAAEYALLAA